MNVNVQVNVWYSVQGLESQNFRENFNVPSNYGKSIFIFQRHFFIYSERGFCERSEME